MDKNFKIVVCASGGGGNFQSLIDGQSANGYTISCLITDRSCGAMERAKNDGIPSIALSKKDLGGNFWIEFLNSIPADTSLVVLAGFMPIIPDFVCTALAGQMINTHPSLLPDYGGKGMYGVKVQEAVMAAHEEFAGCTVHFVTPVIDGGEIILQTRVKVDYSETPWQLGGRIFLEENKLLVKAVVLLKERFDHGKMD